MQIDFVSNVSRNRNKHEKKKRKTYLGIGRVAFNANGEKVRKWSRNGV
jgi:hypothetical protein